VSLLQRGHDAPRSVLLVENSRALASAVVASLGVVEGVDCVLATTLAQARREIEQDCARFFVAVVCLNLADAPDGQIVDVLQAVDLPVIVLTGFLDDKHRTAMFERGVADYVVKDSMAGIEYVARAVARMYRNRNTRMLVVDDTRTFREYASGLLQQHGYLTLCARDGIEALELLRSNPEIRLVVTDYQMPRMDGIAMVQEMRKLRSADDLAIVAMSDSADAGVLARFLKNGANDFLRKPFGIEEFYCRIDQNVDMLQTIADARRLANCDFLTGLHNRRYFFEHARRLHARARSGELRVLAAMIDIDHFKRINDTHGHHGGDEALVAVADRLSARVGSAGLIARFGGEEFAFIGAVSECGDSWAYLEGIRGAIANIDLELDGQQVRITVSIGASEEPGADLDAMLAVADAAVYQAKAQGRNQVVLR
jgi:diguanylate cyclase (GGDEF)-like protein